STTFLGIPYICIIQEAFLFVFVLYMSIGGCRMSVHQAQAAYLPFCCACAHNYIIPILMCPQKILEIVIF
ncbi:MAG: hypothetical protein LIP11_12465, partial [Clostridiales bacterium]|nr:hypothetical protein [Clostridiales bacterium]